MLTGLNIGFPRRGDTRVAGFLTSFLRGAAWAAGKK